MWISDLIQLGPGNQHTKDRVRMNLQAELVLATLLEICEKSNPLLRGFVLRLKSYAYVTQRYLMLILIKKVKTV